MQTVPHIPQPTVPVVTPTIRIHRFYIAYKQLYETVTVTNPVTGEEENKAKIVPGKMREVHVVEYSPLGSDKTIIHEAISRLSCVGDMSEAQKNPAIMMAAYRWAQIEPLYRNWLKGIEPTAEGTPLAAWAGIAPEQSEQLRIRGITTVDQLAALGDTHIQNFGIPNLRLLIDNARRYLQTLDKVQLAATLEEKDARIADLTNQVAELAAMVRDQMATLNAMQGNKQPGPADEDERVFDEATGDLIDPTADAPKTRRNARG